MNPTAFWPVTLVDYAQVISAIATAGAVIVSLWIALRVPKPELTASASIRMIIWPGQPKAPRPEYLVISATNTGMIDAKVINLGWCFKVELRRKKWMWGIQDVSVSDAYTRNQPLPVTLKHGDEVTFYLPLQGAHNWKEQISNRGFFKGALTSRESLEYLYAVVYTSVGKETFTKPGREVLDMIWEAHQEYVEKTAA